MKRIVFAITFVIGSVLAGPVSAEIVYDNFGPGDSSYSAGGTIGNVANEEHGFGFSISVGDFTLDSVVAPINHVRGVEQVTLSLYDSLAGEPGSILDSSTVVGYRASTPVTFNFSGTAVLKEGTPYFLIGSTVNDGFSWSGWGLNNTGATGVRAFRTNLGAWTITPDSTQYGAMRITGTAAVPEPSVLSLLGSTAIGLFTSQRRRRRVASIGIENAAK